MEESRPNIRIEIQNNLVTEAMEIDEEKGKCEEEEGEIKDSEDVSISASTSVPVKALQKEKVSQWMWPNTDGGFTTGVNIFDKDEQMKLIERAKRFRLSPDSVQNFTDGHLQELYNSLGISSGEEKNIRFNAIHMRGTDDMSTEDILQYFQKYGPTGIEWINDESCNIVWNDKISPARALFFMSKVIKGMPVEGPRDPFTKELKTKEANNEEEEGRSILLKNKDREIEFYDEEVCEEVDPDAVNISDITVPIPPGYWRLGPAHSKGKFILLRFAYKSDKKPYHAEKFSEYYKEHGNPNFGGLKGLITESHKRRAKGIFDRNKDMERENVEPRKVNPKNPWGLLAKNWNEDVKFCERIPSNDEQNTLVSKRFVNTDKSHLMSRLGFKKSHISEREGENNENGSTINRGKLPRMKMYADEEEEKIRRKRELQKMKIGTRIEPSSQQPDARDLRSVLDELPYKVIKLEHDNLNIQGDLGPRLKNRQIKSIPIQIVRNVRKESPKKAAHLSELRKRKRERSRSKPRDKTLYSDFYRDSMDPSSTKRTKSRVTIVIKKQTKPTVASKISSRNHERERLKTTSERRMRAYSSSSSSSSESDTTEDSSSSSSSQSSESEDEDVEYYLNRPVKVEKPERPGFVHSSKHDRPRSPLRVEITNDHFKQEH